jgi:hypothetical protein
MHCFPCRKLRSIHLKCGQCMVTPARVSSSPPSTQFVVSYTALLQISSAGVWSVQVQTGASSRTTWVLINGLQVPLNSTTLVGVFSVGGAGEAAWTT